MADEIEIVNYDPLWPELFATENNLLRRVLLPDQFCAIEHAGSTAIIGLASKPIIDIFIAVKSIALAKLTLVEPIQTAEYVYWAENPNPQRMFFVKGMPPFGSRRTHHIHITESGSDHWKRTLQFRDYLRAHPDQARRYAELKKNLATQHRDDREAYTDAKDDFVRDTTTAARAELAAPTS